ncbi:MAG: Flp pilus assembly protein TadB [Clostridiales bacterium]|jgi:tight adherence protein B|nr:Flp pilus assembly protein TadB [Clostridiales bacterium]
MLFDKTKDRLEDMVTVNVSAGRQPDYNQYFMSHREKLLYILAASLIIFIIGYVFYRSFVLSILLCPFAVFYPRIRTKEIIENRKCELNLQFSQLLYSLSSSLSAGKAIEAAFKETLKDLSIQYPDRDAFIIRELETIVGRIEMNETIETALADFATRSHLEDIENFSDVLQTCKRTGGNMVEIIKNTSNIMNDKIEIRQEIDTLLAARKFERKVLNVMPIGMIFLISASAADYMEPVFSTFAGRIAMTLSIILLAVEAMISDKVLRIDV